MYGKGYIPSPDEAVGLGHPPSQLFGAAPLPEYASVPLGPVLDQGQTSSCTGHATAVAIQAAQTRALWEQKKAETGSTKTLEEALSEGLIEWSPLPSRLMLYFDGRTRIGAQNEDGGAVISDLFDACAAVGVCAERDWPFDLSKINTKPDSEAQHAAADQRIVEGAYRITSTGQQRVEDVKRALAAGHHVVWGTYLDMAFERLKPGMVWPGLTGPNVGGHAMVLWEFGPHGAESYFMTRSSWSKGWCENGSARISEKAVASQYARDFWVVVLAPTFLSDEVEALDPDAPPSEES